jgi:hypothetical protein
MAKTRAASIIRLVTISAPLIGEAEPRVRVEQVVLTARRAKGPGGRVRPAAGLALLLAIIGAGPLTAQERSVVALPRWIPPAVSTGQDRDAFRQPPVARMAGLGLLGGVVAGGAVAIPFYLALHDTNCEICTGLFVAVPAVVLAYSAGQALGVHLGNGWRGNFFADLGVSLLATAAGAGLGALAGMDAALLGVAVGLGATVWMEARTSR